MARILVTTSLPATPEQVWDDIRHIDRHVEWMADAVAIRFVTPEHDGVGARFETDTRVGPLRLTDRMVITEWEPGRAMGIRHQGAVTGSGRFTLVAEQGGTRFSWEEDLRFPWWMGGPLGAAAGGQVLKWVWSRNLRALQGRFG